MFIMFMYSKRFHTIMMRSHYSLFRTFDISKQTSVVRGREKTSLDFELESSKTIHTIQVSSDGSIKYV